VCKPAIALELQFYESLASDYPQLTGFVPPFVGKVSVELNLSTTVGSGGCSSSESPVAESDVIKTHSKSPRIPHPSVSGKKRRLVRSSSGAGASYSATLWRKERSSSVAHAASASTTATMLDYLVLGDLTRGFRRPCVLDIKMGTRQHGADATPEKAASHSAKCAATTSLELGLRLCGMQIYDADMDEYLLWDKHWGRRLKAADIEPALATVGWACERPLMIAITKLTPLTVTDKQYLTCGEELRWGTLEQLLRKVQGLRDVVSRTRGLRFWGSSLLLIYEGDCRSEAAEREDVRLIDFAHCQMSAALDSPDDGLLLGLANIARFLQSLLANQPSSQPSS
jgi:inositol-hexakisphosphate kinase